MIQCESGNINSLVVPKYSTWAVLAHDAIYSAEGMMQFLLAWMIIFR